MIWGAFEIKNLLRVYPLHNITELLFEIGAGDLLVALMNLVTILSKPNLSTSKYYSTVNYEVLVALQPDIIIAWASGNGITTINKLKSLGLLFLL